MWTDGEVSWGNARADFDWAKSTALPPRLQGAFPQEPLYLDLRWARHKTDLSLRHPRFADAIGRVAATLRGLSLDELVGEDVKQHQRTIADAPPCGGPYASTPTAAAVVAGASCHQRKKIGGASSQERTDEGGVAGQRSQVPPVGGRGSEPSRRKTGNWPFVAAKRCGSTKPLKQRMHRGGACHVAGTCGYSGRPSEVRRRGVQPRRNQSACLERQRREPETLRCHHRQGVERIARDMRPEASIGPSAGHGCCIAMVAMTGFVRDSGIQQMEKSQSSCLTPECPPPC